VAEGEPIEVVDGVGGGRLEGAIEREAGECTGGGEGEDRAEGNAAAPREGAQRGDQERQHGDQHDPEKGRGGPWVSLSAGWHPADGCSFGGGRPR